MKSLSTSLLFVMNDSDKIILSILIVICIFILYKNTKIKKMNGILTSVEETSVSKLVNISDNILLGTVIPVKKNSF